MPSFTATELIFGTNGTRFVATVTPDAVAAAIVDAVETGRKDVYVPRQIGPMLRTQALLGRRSYENRIASGSAKSSHQEKP